MNKERFYLVALVLSLAVTIWLAIRLGSANVLETVGLVVASALLGGSTTGILELASPHRPVPKTPKRSSGRSEGSRDKPRRDKKEGKKRDRNESREKKSAPPTGKKQSGEVKWFRGSKGYGFITPDGGGDDYFVHRSSIKDGHLSQGDKVEFVVATDDKGRIAAEEVVKVS